MRWEDERYVRLYTRDSTNWKLFSWQAQGLFCLILRKVDRAGVLDLGRAGKRGLTAHIGSPAEWPEIEKFLDELLAEPDAALEYTGTALVVPNFLEAQEAITSDRLRAREYRERCRDLARGKPVTKRDDSSRIVTPSRNVTDASRNVTDRHAAIESRDESSLLTSLTSLTIRANPNPDPPSGVKIPDPPRARDPVPDSVAPPPEYLALVERMAGKLTEGK